MIASLLKPEQTIRLWLAARFVNGHEIVKGFKQCESLTGFTEAKFDALRNGDSLALKTGTFQRGLLITQHDVQAALQQMTYEQVSALVEAAQEGKIERPVRRPGGIKPHAYKPVDVPVDAEKLERLKHAVDTVFEAHSENLFVKKAKECTDQIDMDRLRAAAPNTYEVLVKGALLGGIAANVNAARRKINHPSLEIAASLSDSFPSPTAYKTIQL